MSDELAQEMLKCKNDAYNRIRTIEGLHKELETRLDDTEASLATLKSELKKHEIQRHNSTVEIKEDIQSLKTWFSKHDDKEMRKYDEIINSLKDLTDALKSVKDETDDNSKALMQKRIEEEKQRAIQEALDEANKPKKEILHKAMITAVTIVTGAILMGAWELTMFVVNLDKAVLGG